MVTEFIGGTFCWFCGAKDPVLPHYCPWSPKQGNAMRYHSTSDEAKGMTPIFPSGLTTGPCMSDSAKRDFFASILSILLQQGMPMYQAIEEAKKAVAEWEKQ